MCVRDEGKLILRKGNDVQQIILFAALMIGVTDSPSGNEPEYPRSHLLIEVPELAAYEMAEEVVVLDARSHEKYLAGHIPGARWVDHDEWAKSFGHGNDAEAWSKRIGSLGIMPSSKVVVYDGNYAKDAARIWWILRYWGVENVKLLNGGWVAWEAADQSTETAEDDPMPVSFVAVPRSDRLATKEELLDALKGGGLQIVDARSEAEFCGDKKLSNKRAGAIPGATHLEWSELLDKETHQFKSMAQLRTLLEKSGIDLDQPTATHCQSGGRAAVMVFGLELMGAKDVSNYYPSWAEWSEAADTPVVPGKPKSEK